MVTVSAGVNGECDTRNGQGGGKRAVGMRREGRGGNEGPVKALFTVEGLTAQLDGTARQVLSEGVKSQ